MQLLRNVRIAALAVATIVLAAPRPGATTERIGESPPGAGASLQDARPTSNAGARLYRRHCSFCHGRSGRGDGPDADLFDVPPGDLRSTLVMRQRPEALVAKIRDGAQLNLALDLTALRSRATEIEAIAAYVRRLPGIDWPSVEAGVELYFDRCELCHGMFGKPPATLPSGVARPRDLGDPNFQRSIDREHLLEAIRHSRKGMPPLASASNEHEVKQIAAFVRLFSPGLELYQRYCATCHGSDGRGSGSVDESVGGPTVLDERYFRRRDPEEFRVAIWHMLTDAKATMPHFDDTLSEEEMSSILEYLGHLQESEPPPP